MSFPFTITEQILPGAYIREFPHALSTSQESTLRLAVKIYTPKDNTSPQPGDVTLIAAHANGFPKELYEAMWADLHAEAAKANPPFRIRQIIAVDAAWQNASAPLNEHLLGNDPGWLDYPRDMLHILNTLRPPQPLVGAWTRKSVEEKTLLSDEWKKRLVRPPKPGKTKTEAKI
ncbi:hypothetical protein VdG1_01918 [Verticillium dahliae VDG1]|nr:hypothetical protein VdG1_01918 [Verticillium dahliae VDG1]